MSGSAVWCLWAFLAFPKLSASVGHGTKEFRKGTCLCCQQQSCGDFAHSSTISSSCSMREELHSFITGKLISASAAVWTASCSFHGWTWTDERGRGGHQEAHFPAVLREACLPANPEGKNKKLHLNSFRNNILLRNEWRLWNWILFDYYDNILKQLFRWDLIELYRKQTTNFSKGIYSIYW